MDMMEGEWSERLLASVRNQKALTFVRSYQHHFKERQQPKRLLRHRLPVTIDPSLLQLISGCLHEDSEKRLTASDALQHPYFTSGSVRSGSLCPPLSDPMKLLKPTKSDYELQELFLFDSATAATINYSKTPRLHPAFNYNSIPTFTTNTTQVCKSPWDEMEMQGLYPSVDGALSPATLGD
jgi:serine/threonine protein kinase